MAANPRCPRLGGLVHGGMELRHLVALAVVARERSFRAASRRLGYVHSAVSQQVAELERLADTRLVERAGGGTPVRPTPAGRRLLTHAEEIVTRVSAARADLAALGCPTRVRVGLHEAVAADVVAMLSVLDPMDRDGVVLSEPGEERLLDQLECGELDVGFADLPLPPGPFECVELRSEPLRLLMPASSPWAERTTPPTIGEIAGMPLVGRIGTRLQARIERDLQEQGGTFRFVQRVGSDPATRALVALGLGAAIVPCSSVRSTDRDVAAIDLSALLRPRVLVLVWHRARRLNASVLRFRQAALDHAVECSTTPRATASALASGSASPSRSTAGKGRSSAS
jgi:DNA-binding transcriptional LysR family regulator